MLYNDKSTINYALTEKISIKFLCITFLLNIYLSHNCLSSHFFAQLEDFNLDYNNESNQSLHGSSEPYPEDFFNSQNNIVFKEENRSSSHSSMENLDLISEILPLEKLDEILSIESPRSLLETSPLENSSQDNTLLKNDNAPLVNFSEENKQSYKRKLNDNDFLEDETISLQDDSSDEDSSSVEKPKKKEAPSTNKPAKKAVAKRIKDERLTTKKPRKRTVTKWKIDGKPTAQQNFLVDCLPKTIANKTYTELAKKIWEKFNNNKDFTKTPSENAIRDQIKRIASKLPTLKKRRQGEKKNNISSQK